MAAFGWSASDLAQAVTIVYKVCKALRDTGRASSDYQETVAFLQSLATTLDRVRTFDNVLASSDNIASIHAQVDLVQEPVKEFTRKIEVMFKPRLGSQAVKGVQGAVFSRHRKAQ